MKKGIPEYFALQRFGISPTDVVRTYLHCEPHEIRRDVVITPLWEKERIFSILGDDIETISEGYVYDISYGDRKISFVRSGIGAPQTGDVVLALGCTLCNHLVFTGSVGGLTDALMIGDLVLVTDSICGDGYSNYLREGMLAPAAFLKSAQPDIELNKLLEEHTVSLSAKAGVVLHKGVVFSADTILAQFFHIDSITSHFDCIGIEMETSAVFNSASLVGIQAAALLMVSDNSVAGKSLFSGRTEEDRQRRKYVRESVLSQAILDTLCDSRLRGV